MTILTDFDVLHKYMVVKRAWITYEVVGGRSFSLLVCYSRKRAEVLRARLRAAFEDGIEAEKHPHREAGLDDILSEFFGGS